MSAPSHIETGRYRDGLPYVRFGSGPRPIVGLAALTPAHSPTGGHRTAAMIDRFRFLEQDYVIHVVHRRPRRTGATIGDMSPDLCRASSSTPAGIA